MECICMRNIELTIYLRTVLKQLRKKNNIRGDVLAKKIKKGPAYISQIESGKIKELDFDMLTLIFKKIASVNDENFPSFIIQLIDHLIENQDLDTLLSEDWIQMYDLEYRIYPIPVTLVVYLSETMQSHGVTSKALVNRMNHPNSRLYKKPPFNKILFPIDLNHPNLQLGPEFYYMHFKLPLNYIDKILSFEINTTTYPFMAGILYYLNTSANIINCSYENSAFQECHSILIGHNFFTAFERYDNYRSCIFDKTQNTQNFTTYGADSIDNHLTYSKLISLVSNKFTSLFTKNPTYAYVILSSINHNLENDLELSTALMSSSISSIDISLRTEFWNDYQVLLNKYIAKSSDIKKET